MSWRSGQHLENDDADVDAKWVAYGEVHGLGGHRLSPPRSQVALQWGTPIALAFGLLAALGTTLTTMFVLRWGSGSAAGSTPSSRA